MKTALAKGRYSKYILPVPWPFIISRFYYTDWLWVGKMSQILYRDWLPGLLTVSRKKAVNKSVIDQTCSLKKAGYSLDIALSFFWSINMQK